MLIVEKWGIITWDNIDSVCSSPSLNMNSFSWRQTYPTNTPSSPHHENWPLLFEDALCQHTGITPSDLARIRCWFEADSTLHCNKTPSIHYCIVPDIWCNPFSTDTVYLLIWLYIYTGTTIFYIKVHTTFFIQTLRFLVFKENPLLTLASSHPIRNRLLK